MKKTTIFKSLIDILYILHVIGLIGILFILPFGTVQLNQDTMNIEDWSLLHWSIVVLSLSAYLLFLRGLYFLRKMARFLLSNNYFSLDTIASLKKSGKNFLYTGIISFTLIVILWTSKLSGEKFNFTYDKDVIIPLFLSIIGIFFIIQSNALILAKGMKEENELTV
jgi:hypothetical protein